jgi:hypothetical protein
VLGEVLGAIEGNWQGVVALRIFAAVVTRWAPLDEPSVQIQPGVHNPPRMLWGNRRAKRVWGSPHERLYLCEFEL